MTIGYSANWECCLMHLLSVRLPGLNDGTTLYGLLDALDRGELKPLDARNDLAKADLGLFMPGEVASSAAGYVLAIPNSSAFLSGVFEETRWAGNLGNDTGLWKDALRQAPKDIVMTDKGFNRIFVNSKQKRCTLLIFKAMRNALPTLSELRSDA